MNDFLKKFIENSHFGRSINKVELIEFIKEVYFLYKNKYPSDNDLNLITKSFEYGMFDIGETINKITNNSYKLNINIMKITDKQGNVIKIIIS